MNIPDIDLIKLDGICTEDTQKLVNHAKERLNLIVAGIPDNLAKVLCNIKQEANNFLKLNFVSVSMHRCPVCKNGGDYKKYTRTTRLHRKGAPNYKYPVYLNGFEFNGSNIYMKDFCSKGCCYECWDKYKNIFLEQLKDLKCELPEKLFINKYIRNNWMKCTSCRWEGLQKDMLKKPALMGGYYFGGCPNCLKENNVFDDIIKFSHYILSST